MFGLGELQRKITCILMRFGNCRRECNESLDLTERKINAFALSIILRRHLTDSTATTN